MSYIYESTNSIRIYLKDLESLTTGNSLIFDGFANWKSKDENKHEVNINQELLVDSIGMRMELDIEIINREGINSQISIIQLFEWINMVQNGTHRLIVYPSYDADMDITTLDSFECVMDGYYEVEKLHNFLKSGQNFKFKFKEYIPNKQYIPKIPSVGILVNALVRHSDTNVDLLFRIDDSNVNADFRRKTP